MKSLTVQVTKDSWGVVVWPSQENLVYGNLFAARRNLSSWYRKGFTWSQKNHQILTAKTVEKYFPELGKEMREGDLKIMQIAIVAQ